VSEDGLVSSEPEPLKKKSKKGKKEIEKI